MAAGLVLGGCGAPATSEEFSTKPPPMASLADTSKVAPALARQRIDATKNFLRWYRANAADLDSLRQRAVHKPGHGDTAQYHVDFARAGQYLGRLQQSGVVSQRLVAEQRKQFQLREEAFRRTKQAYGEPVGFDLNWLLLTTNPQSLDTLLTLSRYYALPPEQREWEAPLNLPWGRVIIVHPRGWRLPFDVVEEAGQSRMDNTAP